jgi:hypothetical protein
MTFELQKLKQMEENGNQNLLGFRLQVIIITYVGANHAKLLRFSSVGIVY